MTQVTKYGFTIDTANMPEGNLVALLDRGLNRYMGAEAQSGILPAIRKAINEAEPAKVTKEQIADWREANADRYESLLADERAKRYKVILEGEIGMGRDGDGMTLAERQRFQAGEKLMVELFAKLGKPAFTTLAAIKARMEVDHDARLDSWFPKGKRGRVASEEAKEYVADQKHAKIADFLAKVEPADGPLHKHARALARKLDAIKAEAEAAKAEREPTPEGDLDELAA